ncbi:hypothetical protein Tco_0921399 [Tanacetum coccineum]
MDNEMSILFIMEKPKAIPSDETIQRAQDPLIMGKMNFAYPRKEKSVQDIPITSPKINFLSEEFTGEFVPIPLGMDENEFDEEEDDCYNTTMNDDSLMRTSSTLKHHLSIWSTINNESLKNNPTPDYVLKSPSSFPIPVVDSDSFFEESDTSLSHLDNSLPEFETFSDHTEETRSDSTTTHCQLTLFRIPEFESFYDPSFPRPPPEPPDVEICLHFEPDAPVIDNFNELNDDQRGSMRLNFSQNVEYDDSFTYFNGTFLRFSTNPRFLLYNCSTGSEDTIFDPDIST